MKKYFVSLLLMMVALTINAQPQVKVVIDCSKAEYDKYSEKDLKEKYGDDWNDYWENEVKPMFMEDVLGALNDQESIVFSADCESPYTLTIMFEEIDEDGETDVNYSVIYKEEGQRPQSLYNESHQSEGESTKRFTRFTSTALLKATLWKMHPILKSIGKHAGVEIKGVSFGRNQVDRYMRKYKKAKKSK